MSKFRIDARDSTLSPYQTEDQLSGRGKMVLPPRDPYLKTANPFYENLSTLQVEPNQSLYGNSSYAEQVINEGKAYRQGSGELLAKGVGNVIRTIGIEVAKIPGYGAGIVGAIGNELIGDGKQSMRMIVDNAYINAFEQLDDKIKQAMPVYMSKQVQEGNLWDKMGSGAWWADQGASGVGFMAAMFVPGMALKALKIGAGIGEISEVLANLSTKVGKAATGDSWVAKLGLMSAPEGRVAAAVEAKTAELMAKSGGVLDDVAKAEIKAVETATREAAGSTFKYTKSLARNADGYSSAIVNSALESSAEAANTFDNLKKNYIDEGLTEEEASQKAGEGAAAVFKGNMALLLVSNYLDERWIWKSIGSAGEKEAAKSLMSRLFKNGVVDPDVLKNIPKELSRAKTLGRVGKNFGKQVLKEGGYEEGSQTTLQQNVEKGKIAKKGNVFENVLDDLYNVGASYFDDFLNNTELHESIFLGGLLGGGMSIVGTVQENNALRGALYGSEARTKDNSIFAKYGILPETKAQKGLGTMLAETHTKQFRSYKDLMEKDENGNMRLSQKKLIDANLEQAEMFNMNTLYDIAVEEGDKHSQEVFGQSLAANYVHSFLGQEGGKELFQEHVEKQVLPAWQKRFEETFGREATSKESQEYVKQFKSSGERIFNAHKIAEDTNYPERYFHEKSKEYQGFRETYFYKKFQTLVALDSFKARREAINKEISEAGLSLVDLEDISSITDPVKIQKIQEIKEGLKVLNNHESVSAKRYNDFFTKEGVKKMFEDYKTEVKQFEEIKAKVEETKKDLKAKVDSIPERNAAELARLKTIHAAQGGDDHLVFKDKTGERHTIDDLENSKVDLENLKLTYDDVEKSEHDDPTNASDKTISKIVNRLKANQPLSTREENIRAANKEKIERISNQEKLREEAAKEAKTGEVPNIFVEDTEYDDVDQEIEEVYTKKSVNMFPSTGRNLEDDVEEKNGVFVEKLIPSASQQLWFKTLDEEVKKNPTAYTVKVVRNDDKTDLKLYAQIKRNADPEDTNADDLSVVLYKNGKPVMKDGNYVFTGLGRPDAMYTVGETSLSSRIAKSAILNNFFASLGMKKVRIDSLTKAQKGVLEVYGIKDPTKANIERQAYLHAKKEYKDWYESLQNAANTGINKEIFEIQKEEELKNINLGLSDRQRTLIADIDSNIATVGNDAKGDKIQKIVLTEDEYKEVKKQFKLHNLDATTTTEFNIWRIDFSDRVLNRVKKEINAKYEELKNSLSSSNVHLQVAGVTKGHAVKMYEDKNKTKRAWGSPLKNGIPGLKLNGDTLVGGTFAMSQIGFIDVAGERFTIPSGDVVIVDNDGNVHLMKPRNLNESEVQTVLHLLSLRDSEGPTEAIMVEAPENIIFGNSGSLKAPVFFKSGKGNSKKTIISSLISFGSKPDGKNKTGGRGEIYFPKDSLTKIPEVVWTDFEGKTHKIEVRLITEALQTNDFTKIQDLVSFLQQKRFNVNEVLLSTTITSSESSAPIPTSLKFSKPITTFRIDESGKRVPVLGWDQSRSYFDHMLNDVLTTTTQKVDGYPNRVQRNLWFNKNPIEPQEVIDEKGNVKQPQSNAGVVIEDDYTDTLRGKPSTVDTVTQSTFSKTILWDSFGNESSETWNVGKDTKTRGGQPAVEVYRTKVEDNVTGKTYSKEYADKNGIKYDNTSVELHIVPISELPQLETKEPLTPSSPVDTKAALNKKEAGSVGTKQIKAAFEKLREAKTPEEKLNAINTIERNVAKGAVLNKDEQGEVQRIKDKLASEGYETPELLGKQFLQGMKVIVASLIPDENLALGEEIITKVSVPQINKDDKMIQTAQVDVTVGTKASVSTPSVTEETRPSGRRARKPLDEFKNDMNILEERQENVTSVDKVIEESVTAEEIQQIAAEENIKASEVKEKIKSEVTSQMNNPIKPKTLLQKVAARIKKILLSIFLVGTMLQFTSFTFSPSSGSLAYDNLKVENLQSFDNVYLDQDAINKKSNINIITTSQKNSTEPYMIVDKSTGMVHIFEGENLISSAEVGVGENVSDDQTVLKSLFFNSRGKEVSANEAITVSNGNSYLKDGYSSRINWDAGNKSTGAGIFTVARTGDYHGSTEYFLKNERGISVPMALHKVTNATRARKISDGNTSNNRVSNGCVNFNVADIESLSSKGIKVGTKIFVLPDNPTNKYSIVDGKLRFTSNQSTINKTVVPYEALPITLKATNVNSDGKEYLQALSDNKAQLMKLYPSISNDIYNQITKIAYGIFGQESSYGTFGGVRGKYGYVKDELASALTDKDVSVGVTQIRFSSVNSKTRNAFNINSTVDLKNDVTKSAIATMSLLLDMYESQIPGSLKSDFKELLPLGYSNRTEFKKGVEGDNGVYNNHYVKNVNANGNQVSIYLGSSEVRQVTKSELSNSRKSDSADKILTTTDLFKSKIKSGEIIQNCK